MKLTWSVASAAAAALTKLAYRNQSAPSPRSRMRGALGLGVGRLKTPRGGDCATHRTKRTMTPKKQEWQRPLPPPDDDTEAARILEQWAMEEEPETGLQSDEDPDWIPF